MPVLLTVEERIALAALIQTLQIHKIRTVQFRHPDGHFTTVDLAQPVAALQRLLDRAAAAARDAS